MTATVEYDVYDFVRRNPQHFAIGFSAWLDANFQIWHRFAAEADKIYDGGRKHYSARTIIEWLRHHTSLYDTTGGRWKINNNQVPDLARLYVFARPDRHEFFETRIQHGYWRYTLPESRMNFVPLGRKLRRMLAVFGPPAAPSCKVCGASAILSGQHREGNGGGLRGPTPEEGYAHHRHVRGTQ